jgi:hypothetical protein
MPHDITPSSVNRDRDVVVWSFLFIGRNAPSLACRHCLLWITEVNAPGSLFSKCTQIGGLPLKDPALLHKAPDQRFKFAAQLRKSAAMTPQLPGQVSIRYVLNVGHHDPQNFRRRTLSPLQLRSRPSVEDPPAVLATTLHMPRAFVLVVNVQQLSLGATPRTTQPFRMDQLEQRSETSLFIGKIDFRQSHASLQPFGKARSPYNIDRNSRSKRDKNPKDFAMLQKQDTDWPACFCGLVAFVGH